MREHQVCETRAVESMRQAWRLLRNRSSGYSHVDDAGHVAT